MECGYRPSCLCRLQGRKNSQSLAAYLSVSISLIDHCQPQARKSPWVLVTIFAFLGTCLKPLHEEGVRDMVIHHRDGLLYSGYGSELGVHPCGPRARAELARERKEVMGSQVWWYLPVIPELQMLMQDREFVVSLGYKLRP